MREVSNILVNISKNPENEYLDSEKSESSDNSASLTERKKKFALKVPIQNWTAQGHWVRAYTKLRSIYLLNKIREEINLYGTNSHLFDVFGNYRRNLEEVMRNKVKLEEKTQEIVVWRSKVFMPTGSFSRYWNTLLFFLLIHVAFVMPWIMAFSDFYEIGIWSALEIAVDVFFFLDILINLNTAYKGADNNLVTDHKLIFNNYLKGFLIADLLSVFPLYLINQSEIGRLNILIRLVRLFRLGRVLKVIQKFKIIRKLKKTSLMLALSRNLRSYGGMWRLSGLVFFVVAMTHFVACMWYYVARINELNFNTWIARFHFEDDQLSTIYLRCLYFAVTVLTTVGFGDINAFTVAEMVLVIFWMLLGIAFYSILVGTLSSVISTLDIKASLVNARMSEVEKFSQDFKIPSNIVKKMKNFIRTQQNHETISDKEKICFIEEMPVELKFRVALEMFDGAASKIKMFSTQDKIFVSDIVPRLELMKSEPMEIIYEKNEFAENIYFIAEGRVNYVIGKNTIVFRTFMSGTYFGEIELVEKTCRKFSARSETMCKFLIMSSQCFEYILKEYPRIGTQIIKNAAKRNNKNRDSIAEIIKRSNIDEINLENITKIEEKGKKGHFRFSANWVFTI